jgi:hypothetical protein
MIQLADITLVLGIDRQHLEELRWSWPTWMAFKPELLQMPAIVFYDPHQISPHDAPFLSAHPQLRWVPWEMPSARNQREKMINGWVHVPAREIQTTWYLKLDTDAVATGPGPWIKEEWFQPSPRGRLPVFISCKWGYSKPRYVLNLLDDWADEVPALARHPRLDIPYTLDTNRVEHRRIISWLFFGQTAWTQRVVGWLGADRRMPHASQDTFLFYCAKRERKHYVRDRMSKYGWSHVRSSKIRALVRSLGIEPAQV